MTMTLKCKDCGDNYELKQEEVDFFRSKEFPLPLRCKPCRVKRKAVKERKLREGAIG